MRSIVRRLQRAAAEARNEQLTLDQLIEELQKLRRKHRGDLAVQITDSHLNVLTINGVKFMTGSWDSIHLEHA